MQGIEPTLDLLRAAAPRTGKALLRPARYFLAGSGVLTLAFEGFTQGLLELKDSIRDGLLPEYPGSLWPKVTLAALADPRPLTPREIALLWDAMQHADSILLAEPEPVLVEELHVVEALTRSLELTGRHLHAHLGGPAEDTVPDAHRRFVHGVLRQWTPEPSPEYVAALRRPGHGRDHYQRPCRAFTLVAYLPNEIHGLHELRRRISRLLPGRYHWFDTAARHLTVRTLESAPDQSELKSVQFLSDQDLQLRA
ncbi:MAG: hypothetical protein JJ896_10585 [Rhodothermales bacterium]|nr:hypothetical protein [Rhodothermales bacterium]MBO6780088.1 hypothetical protein [Rhodothermales bacterium]